MHECRGASSPASTRACEATTLAARGADWATVAVFLDYDSAAEAKAAVMDHLGRELAQR